MTIDYWCNLFTPDGLRQTFEEPIMKSFNTFWLVEAKISSKVLTCELFECILMQSKKEAMRG